MINVKIVILNFTICQSKIINKSFSVLSVKRITIKIIIKIIIKNYLKNLQTHTDFFNRDINKFILLLRKGVYPWERFIETTLPNKKAFYNQLNLKDITDKDYAHAQRLFEEFKLKNLGDYHNLYVQSNTLLVADVFENFRNKCVEIYDLDPAHFLSTTKLAWQACLKTTQEELELLIKIEMLLMDEKGIRGGICYGIHRYAKASDKYMENYDKILNHHTLRF